MLLDDVQLSVTCKVVRHCSVQVSHIDISKESPCGHGTVICFSVYCGREVHFGELVDGQPADGILQNQLWVDTLADEHKSQVSLSISPLNLKF